MGDTFEKPVLRIDEDCTKLRSQVTGSFKELHFARVTNVYCDSRKTTIYRYSHDGSHEEIPQGTPLTFEKAEDRYRYYEMRNPSFRFKAKIINGMDCRKGEKVKRWVTGDNNSYAVINMGVDFAESTAPLTSGIDFQFSKKRHTVVMPYPEDRDAHFVGDLICGVVVSDSYKNKQGVTIRGEKFEKWFICSEQFYKMWSLIMGKSKVDDPNDFRGRNNLMKGNRLVSNTFAKWQMAYRDNGKVFTEKERKERFWHIRTEPSSRMCHLYAALVLMIFYGELPTTKNVPTNLGDCERNRTWILPRNWLLTIVCQYKISFTKVMEQMQYARHYLPSDKEEDMEATKIDEREMRPEEATEALETLVPNIQDPEEFPPLQ